MAGGETGRLEESEESLAFGAWLFAQACEFVTAAVDLGGLPESERPEIAFAGRSNVGKSSLVNALTGRTTLARTSSTPGRTQQLIFFDLGGRLTLTDLPGYGYARASKTDIKRWTALTRDYLRGRPQLRRVCLLIDARHGTKEADRELMGMLDSAAVVFQLVLTKSDKVPAAELEGRIASVAAEIARHPAGHPEVIATSAANGRGIEALRASLAALASG